MSVQATSDGRIRRRDKWGGIRYVKPAVTVRTAQYPEEAPF
jgi:hypothetical protein